MCSNKGIELEQLLEVGFSRKFATFYLDLAKAEYSNSQYEEEYVRWAHQKGFLAESAYAYGLNEDNYKQYLSDYDYYRIWPLNSWSRIWVNDKLTLKLMLSNPELDGFMPKYYYYSTNGTLKPLEDTPYYSEDVFDDFLSLLCDVGEFACKPCNGSTSVGFVRISTEGGSYYINGDNVKRESIVEFVKNNPNYLFTEYIRPSKEFAVFSPKIHTLRVVVINKDGFNPKIVGGYLRLPNEGSGEANYTILDGHNNDNYNIFCEVDFSTGWYGNAKCVFCNHIKDTEIHPDTKVQIEGIINNYAQLKSMIEFVSRKFSNLEYLGFDIGITDNGFKCMEINTHPGIKYMQIFEPFYTNDFL